MYGDSHENLLEIWAVVIMLSPISSVCGEVVFDNHHSLDWIDWFWLLDFPTNLVRGFSNKEMKFQNNRAILVQIALLLSSQHRNQNLSIISGSSDESHSSLIIRVYRIGTARPRGREDESHLRTWVGCRSGNQNQELLL